jgi:hypothetical protein
MARIDTKHEQSTHFDTMQQHQIGENAMPHDAQKDTNHNVEK